MPSCGYGIGSALSALFVRFTGKGLADVDRDRINELLQVVATSTFVGLPCRKDSGEQCDGTCFSLLGTDVSLDGAADTALAVSLATPNGKVDFSVSAVGSAGIRGALTAQRLCPRRCAPNSVQGVAYVDLVFRFSADAAAVAGLKAAHFPVSSGGRFQLRYQKDLYTFRHTPGTAEIILDMVGP